MTYQVLARKWRPRGFREMAGQSHVLKTLINSLDSNRLHHAYLFTGTRGVGKTTVARILAKCLNCEQGVGASPCGQCTACREIDEGRFIDLIEVDAASRTKVEDTRELLDNVQYSPTRGRYKVYLIDEVHMLSGHSFNALLKTLEEPPEHVKFLLATTDPQKLPVTVLSRCLQFNLKNLSPEQLVTHLSHVLDREEIPYEEAALWQIGRAAQGSVRDALTLLDQAISFCGGEISDHDVRALLGTIDQSVIQQLVDALAARDAKAVLDVVAVAAAHSPDFAAVLEDLLSYLHRLAVAQVVPEGIDNSQGDRDSVLAHAGRLPAENVQLYYQIALKGREELPLAVDPRSGLEMTLLRMLAFTPDGVPDSPTVPLNAEVPAGPAPGEPRAAPAQDVKKKSTEARAPDSSIAPVPAEPQAEAPPHGEAPVSAAEAAPRVESTPDPQCLAGEPQAEPQPERAEPAANPRAPGRGSRPPEPPAIARESESAPLENADSSPQISLETLDPDSWITLFHALPLTGITRNIAANCALGAAGPEGITLVLEDTQAAVFNAEHQRRIGQALNDYFGRPVALSVETGELRTETPAARRKRLEAERRRQAVQTFENDATVREIIERFSGTIQPDSIVPLAKERDGHGESQSS